jgi:hypothetical protein
MPTSHIPARPFLCPYGIFLAVSRAYEFRQEIHYFVIAANKVDLSAEISRSLA